MTDSQGRILGLDPGAKRIGVAISDPMRLTAQGVTVIERDKSEAETLEAVARIVREREVCRVVVGLPLNMDGSAGPSAKLAMDFVEKLSTLLELPIETLDERLSTVQAERSMVEAGLSRQKRKQRIDKVAAQLILQTYLDRERSRPGSE